MSKYTPGPWFGMIDGRFADTNWMAENDEANVSASAPITDANGQTVALVVSEEWTDLKLDANAFLIAAAPELLEALELCFSMAKIFHRDTDDVWVAAKEKIEHAIAKAKGLNPDQVEEM